MEKESIIKQIAESIETKTKLYTQIDKIVSVAECLARCYERGNKILVSGNGGSAADAQHMAGELVGRFKMERKGLPCIALTTDTSILTAWTNDYDYSTVFSRQIEALGNGGDVYIGISTSGNSENIIKAVQESKSLGLETVLLLGKGGGKLKEMGDYNLIVPSYDTARIQESHIMLIHILCDYVEQRLFGTEERYQ